ALFLKSRLKASESRDLCFACFFIFTSSAMLYPRIHESVDNIHDQIEDNHQDGINNYASHRQSVISIHRRIDERSTKSWNGKYFLYNQTSRKHSRNRWTQIRNNGKKATF